MAAIVFGPEGAVQALIFSLVRFLPIKDTVTFSLGEITRTPAPMVW